MYKHLLVPTDVPPLARQTVEQAVFYACAGGASQTFQHARADLAALGEGGLLEAMSPDTFAEAAAGNMHAIVAMSENVARAAGVRYSSTLMTSDQPHEAIGEVAREAGCDLVFMATHRRCDLNGVLFGPVKRKVLERAELPVLVVEVESNRDPISDEQRALSILRDEHSSLAAVLHALLAQVEAMPPDAALLRAMLFYLEQFPERLHHPKEDIYLFDRLRQRTADFDSLLNELNAQHDAEALQFLQMRSLLDSGDGPGLAQAARAYARAQWRHMRDEEQFVMPAASLHLLPGDWQELAAAFAANDDPRFGVEETYGQLVARLLDLAGRAV